MTYNNLPDNEFSSSELNDDHPSGINAEIREGLRLESVYKQYRYLKFAERIIEKLNE